MGLYTSIYFTPVDRTWMAPPAFIRDVAAILEVTIIDLFTVYRVISDDAGPSEDERYEMVCEMSKVPVEEALLQRRAGKGQWTHVMFPCGDFMRGLHGEIFSVLPEALYRDFVPWDASICDGYWAVEFYENGERNDGGVLAFVLSASGCPANLPLYLEEFLEIRGVAAFQRKLEALSSQPWTAVINLG